MSNLVSKLTASIFLLILLYLLLNMASGANSILSAIGQFNVGLINTLQGGTATSGGVMGA